MAQDYVVTDKFTAADTSIAVTVHGSSKFGFQVWASDTTATAWSIVLEGSLNNEDWTTLITHANTDGDGKVLWTVDKPCVYMRAKLVSVTLGPADRLHIKGVAIR
jgi:hypothetical protein